MDFVENSVFSQYKKQQNGSGRAKTAIMWPAYLRVHLNTESGMEKTNVFNYR